MLVGGPPVPGGGSPRVPVSYTVSGTALGVPPSPATYVMATGVAAAPPVPPNGGLVPPVGRVAWMSPSVAGTADGNGLLNGGGRDIRRSSEPFRAQQLWDAIRAVRGQKQIPAITRMARYMNRFYQIKKGKKTEDPARVERLGWARVVRIQKREDSKLRLE